MYQIYISIKEQMRVVMEKEKDDIIVIEIGHIIDNIMEMMEIMEQNEIKIERASDMNWIFKKVKGEVYEQTILGVLQMKPMLLEVKTEWDIISETIDLGLGLYCNSTELRFIEEKLMEAKNSRTML